MDDLSADQRLTVLAWALRSVLTSDGTPETLWDRLEDVGVPVADLLRDALPMSSPPYSAEEFRQMIGARSSGSNR